MRCISKLHEKDNQMELLLMDKYTADLHVIVHASTSYYKSLSGDVYKSLSMSLLSFSFIDKRFPNIIEKQYYIKENNNERIQACFVCRKTKAVILCTRSVSGIIPVFSKSNIYKITFNFDEVSNSKCNCAPILYTDPSGLIKYDNGKLLFFGNLRSVYNPRTFDLVTEKLSGDDHAGLFTFDYDIYMSILFLNKKKHLYIFRRHESVRIYDIEEKKMKVLKHVICDVNTCNAYKDIKILSLQRGNIIVFFSSNKQTVDVFDIQQKMFMKINLPMPYAKVFERFSWVPYAFKDYTQKVTDGWLRIECKRINIDVPKCLWKRLKEYVCFEELYILVDLNVSFNRQQSQLQLTKIEQFPLI